MSQNQNIESEIFSVEEKLRQAMIASDVKILDELLSPLLLFTNHLGQVLKKEDDLAAHQSGLVKITELIASELQIQLNGDVAVVSVRMSISGTYNNNPANGNFRFTRVWTQTTNGNWQIVAGHAGLIT